MSELDDINAGWPDADRDAMPDDLRAELAAPARRLVDPRTMPARLHHLRAAGQTGAHCLHAFQDEDGDTLARRLGSGTHGLLLGKPVALWDEPAKSGKGKAKRDPRSEAWREFQAANVGAVILNAKEMDAARRMVDAIMACGPASRLLTAPGVIMEGTILFEQCGRRRQSTPDLRRNSDAWGPSFNAEIKTGRDVSPWRFGVDAERMTYHAQLADQAAAIEAHTGKPPRESFIVAVESPRPHVVQVYEVERKDLDRGAQLCAAWLERLQLYEATNQWGGYSPGVLPLEFPIRGGYAIADDGDGGDA